MNEGRKQGSKEARKQRRKGLEETGQEGIMDQGGPTDPKNSRQKPKAPDKPTSGAV
jgi:hypothetical protein